jgi:hypothetical protein
MPTSITVVQPDGTIWTSSTFTQVTPPAAAQEVHVAPGETVEVIADEPAA